MDDLIKRQDAINSIESHIRTGDELYPITETDKILNHAFEISASCIYNMPSAEPKQKIGHWIPWKAYYGEDRKSWSDELKCSECGYKWGDEEYKFCPSCGSRMECES